jgi:hypothetical protein
LGPTFQVGCRALLEFGRTKLSTKKVGNKIVRGGEGESEKVGSNFFKMNYFSGFLVIVKHPGQCRRRRSRRNYSIKTTIYFFRAPLDERTMKTYFSGFGKQKNNSASKRQKLGPTFPSRVSSPSCIWPDQTSDQKSWEQNCHGREGRSKKKLNPIFQNELYFQISRYRQMPRIKRLCDRILE